LSDSIFGTDGIRGRYGKGWLTQKGAEQVGFAAGQVLAVRSSRSPHALLAHDGRASGPELERALARGLAAAGVRATSAGLIPTPALAWLARHGDYAFGLMVSASHNPAQDNGIKVFDDAGEKPDDATQAAIETILRSGETRSDADTEPDHAPDLLDAYAGHLVKDFAAGLDLSGLHIVLDCANGAGSTLGPLVLESLGAKLVARAATPDGVNINEGCGSTKPEGLQADVVAHGADIGIALDGDGDRCILVDANGDIVHGDGILTVLGRHSAGQPSMSTQHVVATVMSNRGLHRALRDAGVGVLEVAVGDRAVVEGMRKNGLALGGEQSGHVVLGERNDHIGDGLATGLAVLGVMHETGESLRALAAPYVPFPQILINVPVSSKPSFEAIDGLEDHVLQVERELGDDGRVLLRYSGTENLARVMVEGPDADTIQRHADALADRFRTALGSSA
jgi:phosphoglucosamine mutase